MNKKLEIAAKLINSIPFEFAEVESVNAWVGTEPENENFIYLDITTYRTHGQKDEEARDRAVWSIESDVEKVSGLKFVQDACGDSIHGKVYSYHYKESV